MGSAYFFNGDGIYAKYASPRIEYCAIEDCTTSNGYGGGMYLEHWINSVVDCTIDECHATVGGGGVYLAPYYSTNGLLVNCKIRWNTSTGEGAGLYISDNGVLYGGVVYYNDSSGNPESEEIYHYNGVCYFMNYPTIENGCNVVGGVLVGPEVETELGTAVGD